MAHYFINDGADKRTYERITDICGKEFRFLTSDGVFSKKDIDDGTYWLLTGILPLIKDDEVTIADLGCGYGVIGIVIAVMKPRSVCVMFDINEKAAELANINAARNSVADRASASVRDGLSNLNAPVDYVVTNPPFRAGKQVVRRFFAESREALKPGGVFFAVLRKQQGAESYIKAIVEIFGNCDVILKKKGYVVVGANKL